MRGEDEIIINKRTLLRPDWSLARWASSNVQYNPYFTKNITRWDDCTIHFDVLGGIDEMETLLVTVN